MRRPPTASMRIAGRNGLTAFATAFVMLVLPATTVAAQTKTESIAVLIGNKNYQRTLTVKYAQNDIAAMKAFLIQKLGYRERNIYEVKDATSTTMRRWFGDETTHKQKLYRKVKRNGGRGDVFVYYSGHGAPDQAQRRTYLVPVDVNPNEPTWGLAQDTLERNLAEIGKLLGGKGRVFLMLEACFSGESPAGPLLEQSMSFKFKSEPTPGIVRLSAARSNQVAWWDKAKKLGLFTRWFLQGAGGEADSTDFFGNGDGIVSFSELQRYTEDRVSRVAEDLWNRDQEPEVTGADGVEWSIPPGRIEYTALEENGAGTTVDPPPPSLTEGEAYDLAKQAGNVEAWDAFLKNFPDGDRAGYAQAERTKIISAESRARADEQKRQAALAPKPVAPPQPAYTPQVPAPSVANCGHPHGQWRVRNVKSWDTLNVRSGPRASSGINGRIPAQGSGISVYSCQSSGWCRVQYKCVNGWANSKYLTSGSGGGNTGEPSRSYRVVGVRSDDVLWIRRRPTGRSRKVGSIPSNGRGVIIEKCVGSGKWCLVRYRGFRGYSSRKFLAR